jgi:hypothetical protein
LKRFHKRGGGRYGSTRLLTEDAVEFADKAVLPTPFHFCGIRDKRHPGWAEDSNLFLKILYPARIAEGEERWPKVRLARV